MSFLTLFLSRLWKKSRPAQKDDLPPNAPLNVGKEQQHSQTDTVDEHQELEYEQHQSDIPNAVLDSLEFKEPDLRFLEVRKRWEQFSAKYARPEPAAFQFTKKRALFQLKEKVKGVLEDVLDQKWLITPPSLKLAGAVRSGTDTAAGLVGGDIHRGTLEGEKYLLKIRCLNAQADGKEQIELQIRPKPNEEVAFSQLTVKIVNPNGEVAVEEFAPFDETGIAHLEIPNELKEGDYAIIVE